MQGAFGMMEGEAELFVHHVHHCGEMRLSGDGKQEGGGTCGSPCKDRSQPMRKESHFLKFHGKYNYM